MLYPAMFTGTLALTVFCLALACDRAACKVAADCEFNCAWPEPPLPIPQPELVDWLWLLPWLVQALLFALLSALFAEFWLALLLPPETSPPATLTGVLPFTVFWWALACDRASCRVAAAW